MERHITSILSALILGCVIWVGSALTDNIDTSARTDVRLGNIEEDINDLKVELSSRMKDRYTGAQAKTRNKVVDGQIDDINQWRRQAERRLDRLELINGGNP